MAFSTHITRRLSPAEVFRKRTKSTTYSAEMWYLSTAQYYEYPMWYLSTMQYCEYPMWYLPFRTMSTRCGTYHAVL
jgi:hypothetical protein